MFRVEKLKIGGKYAPLPPQLRRSYHLLFLPRSSMTEERNDYPIPLDIPIYV
jgi:hypothetical protein